jgi:hypothetical protein
MGHPRSATHAACLLVIAGLLVLACNVAPPGGGGGGDLTEPPAGGGSEVTEPPAEAPPEPVTKSFSGAGNGGNAGFHLSEGDYSVGWAIEAPRDANGDLLGCDFAASLSGPSSGVVVEHSLSLVEPRGSGFEGPKQIAEGDYSLTVTSTCTTWTVSFTTPYE